MQEFAEFQKIYRVSRPCVITEKIDGTNGQICIGEDGEFLVGCRTRWLNGQTGDNHGFFLWALEHKDELLTLGVGRHFGEWWGQGIQRTYGLKEKRFSLFNTARWSDPATRPACCHVVPVLFEGMFDTAQIERCISDLRANGSKAAPGFMKPEGVVCFHCQGNFSLKKTLEKDEEHKSQQRPAPQGRTPKVSWVGLCKCRKSRHEIAERARTSPNSRSDGICRGVGAVVTNAARCGKRVG